MFDSVPQTPCIATTAPPVLFLSDPFGTPGEWSGVSEFLGPRGNCRAFDDPAEWRCAVERAPKGAHLAAHGTAGYHALKAAMDHPHAVRSVTLVDPDIIRAIPDLMLCCQFRGQLKLIARATALASDCRHEEAAAKVMDWWRGPRSWKRTAPRTRAEFVRAMPLLADEWWTQDRTPLSLLRLARLSCPIKVISGRRMPSEVRSLAHVLRMAIPDFSLQLVKSARALSHLTHPQIVSPEIGKFIVCSDMGWHSDEDLALAA
ncbi:MAG: alpha/beta hydrolase [Rhodobacteraceae bacterium]|nr:alpha/beta hydrolase [Paracoccaceae bacterium]